MPDSFEDFKESFYYGARSDLSFKFLNSMSDEAAADFLQELLTEVGAAYDTGDLTAILDLAYRTQVAGYQPDGPPRWTYDDRPFTPIGKSLKDSRVGLLTSSGHFVAGNDPNPLGVEDMSQREAEDRISEFMRAAPLLTSIPRDTPAEQLVVRHGGYDTRAARHDHNVTFPRDALVAAAQAGRIGEVADTLYSFPGATAQGRVKQIVPEWAEELAAASIDVLLLVPV